MSKAARNARKQEQRATGTKYQHPTRDGIPYGHSKNSQALPAAPSASDIAVTRAILGASREMWPEHVQPGGFR